MPAYFLPHWAGIRGDVMSNERALDLESLKLKGTVTADDVLALRRAVFENGTIEPHEAETLFDINLGSGEHCLEWNVFFVEALTDFVVHQALPQGYVTSHNANWLIERVTREGVVETATELELLVKIIEAASYVPERLVDFTLGEMKRAIVEGRSLVHPGVAGDPGVVTADEVHSIRRVLYGFGGDGHIAVTRAEAEILFDINDATEESRNDPAWSDLFVKAIANHLMAASGYQVPSREQALAAEQWLEERDELSFGSVLAKMLQRGLSGVFDAYHEQDWEATALDRLAQQHRAIVTAEAVTELEASWLAERIGRDGVLKVNERALLSFLRAESPKVHPSLLPLIARAA